MLTSWKGILQLQFAVSTVFILWWLWVGSSPIFSLVLGTVVYILYIVSCFRTQVSQRPMMFIRMTLFVAGAVVAFGAAYALYSGQDERFERLVAALFLGYGFGKVSEIFDGIFYKRAELIVEAVKKQQQHVGKWVPPTETGPVRWSEDEDFS